MSAFKADMGAKDEFDLLKKIGTMEFNDPLLIVLSLGAQMLRLEQRYLLNGIDFREAYGRRIDQLNTLMAVTYDLYQVGLTKQVVNLISEFASEYISPNFDLNTVILPNSSNNNGSDSANSMVYEEVFAFDGSKFYFKYDNSDCVCELESPMLDKYEKSLVYSENESNCRPSGPNAFPKFINGKCWRYNMGHASCPHTGACMDKTPGHLRTHRCFVLGGNHPFYNCPLVRSFMFISNRPCLDWGTRSFGSNSRQSRNDRNRYGNNRNNRNNNRRKQNGGDGGLIDAPPQLFHKCI